MEKRELSISPYTTLWKDDFDDDIILWNYAHQLEIDITIAKELVKTRLEYCHGKSVFALIDGTQIKSTTREARDYMNSPEGGLKGILGGAFLSKNPVATLSINLYLKINKPSVPAKFFTNKEDALQWLKRIKEEMEVESVELTTLYDRNL